MPIPPKLLLLFIAIPVIEVVLFIKIGGAIGLWATLGIIVITAFFGAWLTRSQGIRALERFHGALQNGRPPQSEIFGGILILIAGILLIAPGFLTDTLGFLLLIPSLRASLLSRFTKSLNTRLHFSPPFSSPTPPPPDRKQKGKSSGLHPRGKIVDADILDK